MNFESFKSIVQARYPNHSFVFMDGTHKYDEAMGPITSKHSEVYIAYAAGITVKYLGALLYSWRVNGDIVDW